MNDCFFHGEEPTDVVYGSCLECGHVWRTREDFLADIAAIESELGLAPHPDHEYVCPLCTHDL